MSKKIIRKSKRVKTAKAQPGSLHPAGSAHTLAATIAAALFTSGDGKRASRLHFILEGGEVWGGWSEPAVAAQIEKLLSPPNEKAQ